MNAATRILTILFCLLLCAGGAIWSVKATAKGHHNKTKVVPVINHQPKRAIRIWVSV